VEKEFYQLGRIDWVSLFLMLSVIENVYFLSRLVTNTLDINSIVLFSEENSSSNLLRGTVYTDPNGYISDSHTPCFSPPALPPFHRLDRFMQMPRAQGSQEPPTMWAGFQFAIEYHS